MRLSRATCTMAEVPLPTPTQVPVPSTDIRNAVFAGAKLDEEVTGTGEFYTDRLGVKRLTNTGRNNQFDAAQLDRANRFEQFLLSSGYVFLGDYEDGPFQFSARNQYIRYNNQYYRLNAATDVGFTTTGTDATSFANDVTHFVLMDGDTIRQELGSGDGQKLVGKCATLGVLRTIEPEYHGQEIILFRAVNDGPVLNERLYYDALDSSTPDNDLFVFVTPSGARWKVNIDDGYNVWLAGFVASDNNLVECINKISSFCISNTRTGEIPRLNDRALKVKIPAVGNPNIYTLNSQLKYPVTLMHLEWQTSAFLDCSSVITDCVVASNEYDTLLAGMGNSYNGGSANQGGGGWSCLNGAVFIKGPGTDYSNGAGFILGNKSRLPNGTSYLHVRDVNVSNIRVFGCNGGIEFGTHDTYCCGFTDAQAYANNYGHYQPNTLCLNSGERLYVSNFIYSDNLLGNHYINTNGHDYFHSNGSNDYSRKDAILYGPDASGTLTYTDCHVEGFAEMMINQPAKNGSAGQCRFQSKGGKIDPRSRNVTYRGVRKIFNASTYNSVIVELIETDLGSGPAGYMCNDAYGSWAGYGNQVTVIIKHRVSDVYKWLPRFRYGVGGYLLNPEHTFTGSPSDTFPTTVQGASLASAYHFVVAQGGATIAYGSATNADSDGLIPVAITMPSDTSVLYLYHAGYAQFPRNTAKLSCKCSVKCGSATGSINVQAVVRPLTYQTITVNSNVVTAAETSRGQVLGDSVDVLNTILTKPYLTITANDFVSTPPLQIDNYFLGSLWSNPGLRFYGFVGTIYVKLPAYWFNANHPNT